MNSIDGATALKLDETYEIKNNEEQNALIDSFESNEENKIAEYSTTQSNIKEEIPTGVSIESASYIEKNSETKIDEKIPNDNLFQETSKEEYTPKLFSDDQTKMKLKPILMKKMFLSSYLIRIMMRKKILKFLHF